MTDNNIFDKFFKIDVHTHILPEYIPNFKEQFGYGGFINMEHHKPNCARMIQDGKFFREVQANLWDARTRIKECDDANVNIQVLSTVPVMFSYWAKPQDTLIVSQYLNNHIAEVTEKYPDRFVGLGTLPMQDPDLAIEELRRIHKDLHLAGIEIGTHVNDMNLNSQNIFPIFKEAENLGSAIFVHPWDMMGKDLMPKYWLPWLVGMPAETSLAICSMIFGGIFEKLPKLRVCFAHGGGSFPGTVGRIEHGFKVRPDLCAIDNNVNPRAYLGKFWVDSIVHDPDMLRYIINLISEEKIVLGSDYPFPLGELKPGNLINSIPEFSSEIKTNLYSKNALKWLNLSINNFVSN